MVKLSSKKVSKHQFWFFFSTPSFLQLSGICAELNNYVGKKEPLPLTCLDTCRMLSISSTGNVVVRLNGQGGRGGGVMSIQSVLYVAWCDQHFRGFCKWKKKQIIFPPYTSPLEPRVENVLFLEAEKQSCLQGCLH